MSEHIIDTSKIVSTSWTATVKWTDKGGNHDITCYDKDEEVALKKVIRELLDYITEGE